MKSIRYFGSIFVRLYIYYIEVPEFRPELDMNSNRVRTTPQGEREKNGQSCRIPAAGVLPVQS